jgi:glyoxylase-like metal-dependent hydrolase (beta-lactamase superfamily II)
VKTFEPGTTVLPGFNAIAVNGHTPGHMSYEIVSGKDRLLDIGDVRAQFDPLTRQT